MTMVEAPDCANLTPESNAPVKSSAIINNLIIENSFLSALVFQIENPWFPKEFRRDISSTFCYTGSGDEFSVSELCGPVNPFSDIFCFNFKQVLKFLFSSHGLYYFETGDYVDKIQVLAIVPYEGMKFSLSEVASQRQDMEIEIHIGDLEKGLDIVNALPLDSYDVILSRGGTAQMLRDATELPVVEISLSVYDILRSLRLAQNYTLRHAIVGFPSITDVSCLLRDLIQREINIFPIHNSEEATQVLQTLKADGYQMVIGDMITSTLAKQAGLNSVLITSGTESIENALNTVAEQYHSVRRQRRLNKLLLETLRSQNVQAFILDAQGQAVINTLSDQAQELKNSLKKEVDSLSKRGHYTYTKKSRDKTRQYIVEAQQLEADHLLYNALFLTPDLSADFIGIEYIDAQKAEKRYLDSFFISGSGDFRKNETLSKIISPLLAGGRARNWQGLYGLQSLSAKCLSKHPPDLDRLCCSGFQRMETPAHKRPIASSGKRPNDLSEKLRVHSRDFCRAAFRMDGKYWVAAEQIGSWLFRFADSYSPFRVFQNGKRLFGPKVFPSAPARFDE